MGELEKLERQEAEGKLWEMDAHTFIIKWNRDGKMALKTENCDGVRTLEVIGVLETIKACILEGMN